MFGRFGRKSAKPVEANERVSVRDTGPCQKAVRARIEPGLVASVREALVGELRKASTLPGFRKGKAPAPLVVQKFTKEIQDKTRDRVTVQVLEDVVRTHALRPVGPFQISRAESTADGGLQVDATVEVEPTFPLAEYQGIRLSRRSAQVTPEDVDQAVQQLRESMAHREPAGEGKPKVRTLPPVDEELAKDLGFASLAALRDQVKAKLAGQKRTAAQHGLEAALSEALLARHQFEVPASMVSHQTERLARDFKARRLLAGVTQEQVEQETAQFSEQLRANAQQHVKLGFILDRIAERESVQVGQDELVSRLWGLANRWRKDPVEVRKLLDNEGLWPSVISSVVREKTLARLLAAAQIEDEGAQSAGAPAPQTSGS